MFVSLRLQGIADIKTGLNHHTNRPYNTISISTHTKKNLKIFSRHAFSQHELQTVVCRKIERRKNHTKKNDGIPFYRGQREVFENCIIVS